MFRIPQMHRHNLMLPGQTGADNRVNGRAHTAPGNDPDPSRTGADVDDRAFCSGRDPDRL